MMKKRKIKLFDPLISSDEEKILKKVLNSKFWASGSGSGYVQKFENTFSKYLGSKSCVAVNSGTAALHLALSLYGLSSKEVILPSLSFVSTAHSVLYNNAKPIFADIEPKTLCIDPDDIRKRITKKTKAILPVHFAGMPCNLKSISQICNEHDLFLVEDAAHAAGSIHDGKKIGSFGDAVCFSFHPVKNLAMPTGGAIALNHNYVKKHTEILKSLRWCGITNRSGMFYDVDKLGWNFYMNEFSAALGIVQLKKLDRLNQKRKSIAKKYFQKINLQHKMPFDSNASYHFYWILIKQRKKFINEMLKNNIEVGIHYKPIHKMSLYTNSSILKNTDEIENTIVSLPTHPNLTESDIDSIIELTNKFT